LICKNSIKIFRVESAVTSCSVHTPQS